MFDYDRPRGVGLALRWELLEAVLSAQGHELWPVCFFEVAPENFMRKGGWLPSQLARVAVRYPLTSHGLMLSAGGFGPLDGRYLEDLRAFLRKIKASYHSDHLAACGHGAALLHELLPVAHTKANAKRIAHRLRQLSQELELPLAIENISYYLTLGSEPKDEAAFIADVLDHSGCGLLLDLNNLDVNAHNHRFEAHAWLEQVPLERVVELHVAGPELDPSGMLIDTHGSSVRPSVLELLEAVVERIGPCPVVLERENHVPSLAALVAEVAQIDAHYRRALSRYAQAGISAA